MLAKYLVIEDQVQKAPSPMKASAYPVSKKHEKITKREPKIEHRFPMRDTMYHALNSLSFS